MNRQFDRWHRYFRDIKVEQGTFRVSSVYVMYATKNLLVVEVNCHSKYPAGCGVASGGEQGPEVSIWVDERSIKLDDSTDQLTVITLPRYADDWTILTEARKYTVRIAAYNRSHQMHQVWSEEEEET